MDIFDFNQYMDQEEAWVTYFMNQSKIRLPHPPMPLPLGCKYPPRPQLPPAPQEVEYREKIQQLAEQLQVEEDELQYWFDKEESDNENSDKNSHETILLYKGMDFN